MGDWWDQTMEYEARRRSERMDTLNARDLGQGMELVWERKICWPKPDATCLEGGCIHCDVGAWKKLSTIDNYVYRAGMVPNRGGGEKPARKAWSTGVENGFFGRPRIRRVRVKKRANPRVRAVQGSD